MRLARDHISAVALFYSCLVIKSIDMDFTLHSRDIIMTSLYEFYRWPFTLSNGTCTTATVRLSAKKNAFVNRTKYMYFLVRNLNSLETSQTILNTKFLVNFVLHENDWYNAS